MKLLRRESVIRVNSRTRVVSSLLDSIFEDWLNQRYVFAFGEHHGGRGRGLGANFSGLREFIGRG